MKHEVTNNVNEAEMLISLGQLAGGVAHDFNNLLAIIEGYTHIIKNKEGQKDDADLETLKYAENILTATRRGSALTRRLLAFGQKKVIKTNAPISVKDHLMQHKVLLEVLLPPNVTLFYKVPSDIYYSKIDPDALWQIILNLVINARDAISDRQGFIVVTLRAHDRAKGDCLFQEPPNFDPDQMYLVLSVSDDGCGIDPDHEDKIYNPFFTTKAAQNGTGLGLSIVHGLVQQMQGTMDFASLQNKGTVFRCFLPAERTEQKENKDLKRKEIAKSSQLYGSRVLIIDDELELLNVFRSVLTDLGCEVLTAVSGKAAKEILDQYDGEIDFVLSDIVMPDVNGVKLFHECRLSRRGINTIFMTGYPLHHDRLSRLAIPEETPCLLKPVEPQELISTMLDLKAKRKQKHYD